MSDELLRTVEHIEEIGVRRDTYLDEFVDDLDEFSDTPFVVFLVETEDKTIGGFLVGVECVDKVLSPGVAVSTVIVEFLCIRDILSRFVCGGVVDEDNIFTNLSPLIALLE